MPETHERFDVPAGLELDFGAAPPRLREPAPPSVLDAARRHPRLVVGALLLALALATAAGLARKPVHTATAQLRVGGFDVGLPGALTGYATASVALASSYSWSVHEPAVVAAVARKVGVPESQVLDAVSASPLPESPVFRVRARAATASRAIALANATAEQLARQRPGMTSPAQRARRQRALAQAAGALAAARAAQRARQADVRLAPTPAHIAAETRAEGVLAAAQVAFEARRTAYLAGAQSATSSPAVELVAPARRAVDDARTTLQLLLIVGAAAGLSAGFALALLAERRARYLRSP